MHSEDVRPSKPRILLVEDDDATRTGYAELLEVRGFIVDAVATALEAIHAIELAVPDVVVTDVTLPDGDGLALASQFREQRRTAHVPIIGITGHWSVDARARARQAGVSAFLLKPSAPAHVIAEIYRVLANEAEDETAGGAGAQSA
jgi:CheY-like chemotaxis protein